MGKKSYNPFKMWGAYLGAVLLSIIAFFSIPSLIPKIFSLEIIPSELNDVLLTPFKVASELQISGALHQTLPVMIILESLAFVIVGFLLGYGIHALIRRLRK